MFDTTGMTTFSNTLWATLVGLGLLILAVGYLRPALRLWWEGKQSFPILGTSLWAAAMVIAVLVFGYHLAFKQARPPAAPSPWQRDRAIQQRSEETLPVRSVERRTLTEQSEQLLEQSRLENERAKQRFEALSAQPSTKSQHPR